MASANREEASRAEIILMSAEGRSASEIGAAAGFHPSNVKKWIRRFNEAGLEGIAVRKRGPQGGPRPKFDQRQIAAILELAATDPMSLGYSFRAWTPQKLASAASERGIVESISHVTVRQILRRYHPDSIAAREEVGGREAQEPSRGLAAELRLGREALEEARHREAVAHFEAALAACETPEDEATVRILLTQTLEELSRYDEAHSVIARYEDANALAALSLRTRARVKLRIGWVNSWIRNYPKAIADLNEANKIFHELQDNAGISEAHYALGRTYSAMDEFRIARDHLLAAARSQRGVQDRELLARVYDQLGTADFNEGAFTSAYENYKRALELAEGTKNPNLLGMILINLGTAHDEGYIGGRAESANYFRRAIDCHERGGHKDYLALAYNNLANNLRDSGLWDEAIENLEKAIEIARHFPDRRAVITARISLAEILFGKQRLAEAEEQLKKCQPWGQDKWLDSNALRILAQVYRRTGRYDQALQAVRQALRLSTSIGDLHGVTLAQVELAEFHLSQGGLEQAREYLELAAGRLKEEKSLFISGLIQRLTGQLEAANGRLAEARQHIAQSISVFTTTDIPYEVARSQYQMGLLLHQAGDNQGAEQSFRQAREVFDRVGAEHDRALADEALKALAAGVRSDRQGLWSAASNDVLLMQRLIEASASRELLLQELAAIISENLPTKFVVVSRPEGGRLLPVVSQGISLAEAEALFSTVAVEGGQSLARSNGDWIVRLCDGTPFALVIRIRPVGNLDVNRLQPLLKQAELGLETCSLRVSARMSPAPSFEHGAQSIIPGFLYCSPLMNDVVERIHKIRTSDVTVLITGESGTGKELIARAIHAMSARARAIFLPFNCTATPKEIIDSQLFGHRRGAFTGATANYPGIIKAADGGTLFLDEIGDLSLEVQPKFMRFLQESEIQPLGETKPVRVDVRVLAATNADLERAVEEGRFREDLFHRLNIIRIHVPPLRDRREEVAMLASHFLEQASERSGKRGITLTQDAVAALTEYEWPGNVRQLRNEIERVIAYASDGARITAADLSPEVAQPGRSGLNRRHRTSDGYSMYSGNVEYGRAAGQNGHASNNGAAKEREPLKVAVARLERRLIQEALIRNHNNLSRTAVDLGLSRRGLKLKLAQLGIQREEITV